MIASLFFGSVLQEKKKLSQGIKVVKDCVHHGLSDTIEKIE